MNRIRVFLSVCCLLSWTCEIDAQVNMPSSSVTLPATTVTSIPYPSQYPQGTKVNWVRLHTLTVPVSNPTSIPNLNFGEDRMQTTFSDGLGRPIQNVSSQQESAFYDVVQPFYYDSIGRQPSQSLPYVADFYSGPFQKNPFTDSRTYNSLRYPNEFAYYAASLYDDTSLSRATLTVQPGAGRAGRLSGVTMRSRVNAVADSVPDYVYDPVSKLPILRNSAAPFWARATLYVSERINRAGTSSFIFKDREGKTILTKTPTDAVGIGQFPSWKYTVYIYDDLSHLRFVLTPKAMTSLGSDLSITKNIVDNLGYAYDYDERSRIIRKQFPGQAEIKIVYDDADRPVLIQDGKLEAINAWLFSKYDALGRIVLTGRFLNSSSLSNSSLASQMAGTPSNPFLAFLQSQTYGSIYSASSTIPDAEIYSINYYDSYQNLPSGYAYSSADVAAVASSVSQLAATRSTETMGKVTAGYTRVMNGTSTTNAWQYFVVYYDQNGRVLQSQSTNFKGGHDTSTSCYNFAGQLVASRQSTFNPACTSASQSPWISILNSYSYTPSGHLRLAAQKINDEPFYRQLSSSNYNTLGQLIFKNLGQGVEIQDFSYRVWGSLDAINKNYCEYGTGGNAFGEILSYDYGFDSISASGLPAGLKWRNKGSGNTQRAYGYLYDLSGQLKSGYYSQSVAGGSWGNTAENYTAENMRYDANGNLASMTQWGTKAGYGGPFKMDQLRYNYENGELSNQLLSITDTVVTDYGLGEFHEVSSGGNDYGYDQNGNATGDANRDIGSITYDYHNKPVQILYNNNGREIDFSYDAAGTLLSKKISENGHPDRVIDYLNTCEYVDNQLSSVAHAEGRARPVTITKKADNSTTVQFEYDFFIRDHAGNIRSLLVSEPDKNWWTVTHQNPTATEAASLNLEPVSYDPQQGGGSTGFTIGDRVYVATMETTNAIVEESTFANIDITRDTKPAATNPGNVNAARLQVDGERVIGPATVIRVMAGDKISLSAQTYYDDSQPQDNNSGVGASQVAHFLFNALSGMGRGPVNAEASGGLVYNGNAESYFDTWVNQLVNSGSRDELAPKGFLNYMLVDEQFNIVPSASGYLQTLNPNSWESLVVPEMEMPASGYLIAFTSNESHRSIFFDDLQITHYKGTLLEENHYYPYGLTLTSNAIANHLPNQVLYQGKGLHREEFANREGLNLYHFGARMYDPQVGRWHTADPLAEEVYAMSLYQYCNDNPVIFSDPTGLKSISVPSMPAGTIPIWDGDEIGAYGQPWSSTGDMYRGSGGVFGEYGFADFGISSLMGLYSSGVSGENGMQNSAAIELSEFIVNDHSPSWFSRMWGGIKNYVNKHVKVTAEFQWTVGPQFERSFKVNGRQYGGGFNLGSVDIFSGKAEWTKKTGPLSSADWYGKNRYLTFRQGLNVGVPFISLAIESEAKQSLGSGPAYDEKVTTDVAMPFALSESGFTLAPTYHTETYLNPDMRTQPDQPAPPVDTSVWRLQLGGALKFGLGLDAKISMDIR